MSSFLIELCSTEKSYTTSFKEISHCSSFAKPFDTLPKQKLNQVMLTFALNLHISVLFSCHDTNHHCNANLSKILYLLY